MSGRVPEGLDARVRAVSVAAAGPARRAELREVVTLLYPVLRSWAYGSARGSGSRRREDVEDVAQAMAERVLVILREPRTEGIGAAYLHRAALFAAKSQTATEWQSLSGSSGAIRRGRAVAATRDRLMRQTGNYPTAEQLADTHNREMRARRSNPEKQGVLVSVDEAASVLRGLA